jgi:hypothetical protein
MAFEGKVPRNDDVQFDYVCPTEQVFYTTTEKPRKRKKSQDICKSVCTLNKEWLLDTGATVHVMTNKHLLFNTTICCREIKVANGRHVWARLVGDILLKSECGNYLYLQGVVFSPTLNKNIISAPQLMQSQDYTIIMKNYFSQMRYRGTGINMNLKTTENLYIFIGQQQPEHALKYLALRTMNNSRVLHKTIRKNSCYMKNIPNLPYLSSLNNYSTVQ